MTTKPKGFRRDITVLHHLSELMEKHPKIDRPMVTLKTNSEGEPDNQIWWSLTPNYNLLAPHHDDDGNWLDWGKRDTIQREMRRVDLEERIAGIVEALGDEVQWEKNDPSQSGQEWTYALNTTWHGVPLKITTWRDAVCERVVVLTTEREEEQPDPELAEKALAEIPKVKVKVTDEIAEWQCNERIAAVTAPIHTRSTQVLA